VACCEAGQRKWRLGCHCSKKQAMQAAALALRTPAPDAARDFLTESRPNRMARKVLYLC